MDRRKFIKTTAELSAVAAFNPIKLWAKASSADFFSVHPFIENNPEAVFIMRTDVDVKTNANAIKQAGKNFAQSVLVAADENTPGKIPISSLVAIKPNLTRRFRWQDGYTVEGTMGIVTDVNFVEGIIETLKSLGVSANKIYLPETNYDETDLNDGGYLQMIERTGVNMPDLSKDVSQLDEQYVVWKDVPNGEYFKKIPYLFPVNASDSWLINIAKLKAHSMGVTLCAKNLQGCIAHSYQEHCRTKEEDDLDVISQDHIINDALTKIEEKYQTLKNNIPRWDKPGQLGGSWQHLWATRCIDNNSTVKAGLNIIEGVYGRDGDFVVGPNDGLAKDYMTNVIIFSKNPFYADIIGHWIAGHEPGNFGLFHLAKERGMISTINPNAIPLYEWKNDGSAVLTSLSDFNRTPLKTKFLQRDYNGQDEPYWHLCNEPFDYTTSVDGYDGIIPIDFELKQNYPNPFNPTTTIEFHLPKAGRITLDIFNINGRKVKRLVNAHYAAGKHMVLWNAANFPSGMYFYRLNMQGNKSLVKRMQLIK